MLTAVELTALLDGAYEAFVRLHAARRYGRPTKVLTRDVDTFMGMLAELAHGDDVARVVWAAALAHLRMSRAVIEAHVVDERDGLDLDDVWRAFEARLAGAERAASRLRWS
jgi:hypothetical protein